MRSQKSFVEPSRDPRSRWRQVVAQLSSCGSSCGKGLPCRRSFGFRRSLGHLALRLCGSCSSYVQTAGPRVNLLPSTGLTPKHAALVNGELLLNDLVEKLWPKISEWFQQQLKEQLEPVLKKHVLESLEFEECTLGTAPLELHDITTETYIQDWQGDPWTNIKITGDLDYCGDGEIRVSLRPGGHKVADVALLQLQLRGKLVIELVGLTASCPWFSGLRIYFPNMPEVDCNVGAEVFMLDSLFDTATLVKSRLVQELRAAVAAASVLPNRISVETCQGTDPFKLQHPIPQGILRVEAWIFANKPSAGADAHAASAAAPAQVPSSSSTSSSWRSGWSWLWGGASSSGGASPPPVRLQVSVGAQNRNCGRGEALDFRVDDWKCQHLTVMVADDHVIAEVAIADLVAQQGACEEGSGGVDGACVLELPLPLPANSSILSHRGQATVQLRAQWRPLVPSDSESISEVLALGPEKNCWAVGEPRSSGWLLLVDLFHATGLAAVAEGTEHWVAVTVRERSTGEALARNESAAAAASGPARQGLEALRFLGALRHLDGVGKFGGPTDEEYLMSSIPPEAWRMLLGRTSDDNASRGWFGGIGNAGLDAVWGHPFWLLLDSGEDLQETIRGLELEIAVQRPEKGLSKQSSVRATTVGTASYRLDKLLLAAHHNQNNSSNNNNNDNSEPRCFSEEDLSISLQAEDNSLSAGLMKLRLQLRPLQPPPDLRNNAPDNAQSWGSQVQLLGSLFRAKSFENLLRRSMSRVQVAAFRAGSNVQDSRDAEAL